MSRPGRRTAGRRRLGWLLALFLAAGLAGAVSVRFAPAGLPDLTAALWRLLGVRVATPAPTEAPPAGPGVALPPASQGTEPGTVVASGATFVWTTVYDKCRCTLSESGPALEGLVGLDAATLATELRDWRVASFDPRRVELTQTKTDKMCPAHTKRTLRLEDGKIVLYAGSLEDASVKLIPIGAASGSDLEVGDLGASEIEILKAGKSFDSEEEVYRYIEGLGD